MDRWRVLAAALLALPLWAALPRDAYACTCGFDVQAQVALDGVILVGTAVEQQAIGPVPQEGEPLSSNDIVTTVEVEEYIQGSGGSSVTVWSRSSARETAGGEVVIDASTPLCGVAPVLGDRYLFFLERREGGGLTLGSPCHQLNASLNGDEFIQGQIEEIRAILGSTDADRLPDVGSGADSAADSPVLAIAAASAAVGALLLIAPALARLRH